MQMGRSLRKHRTIQQLHQFDNTSSKGNLSSRRSPDKPHVKTTKILGGHGMAVRDLIKSKSGQHHKLNDQGITSKEFGQQDNNG